MVDGDYENNLLTYYHDTNLWQYPKNFHLNPTVAREVRDEVVIRATDPQRRTVSFKFDSATVEQMPVNTPLLFENDILLFGWNSNDGFDVAVTPIVEFTADPKDFALLIDPIVLKFKYSSQIATFFVTAVLRKVRAVVKTLPEINFRFGVKAGSGQVWLTYSASYSRNQLRNRQLPAGFEFVGVETLPPRLSALSIT